MDLQTVLDEAKLQSFTQDIKAKAQETFGLDENPDFIK